MTELHSRFMKRALLLARKGRGLVHPNPLVGCVLAKGSRIIAEGYHSKFGGAHAEIQALQKAGSRAAGSTIYINLEPCAHWGKTPPCAPALIQAGIRTVYVASKDPNPAVNGRGIKMLRDAGLKVHVGLEQRAAEELNRPFLTWMKEDRPYVILKMALSLDGKIATTTGESNWISSAASRAMVHDLRASSDAVLIGTGTAQIDNPTLSSHGHGRDPIRIVLDPKLSTRPNLRVFQASRQPTWVLTTQTSSPSQARKLEKKGVKILRVGLRFSPKKVKDILKVLSKLSISQLLIEGGGETAWTFLSSGLVDEIYFFVAPILIGGRDAKTAIEGSGVATLKDAFTLKSLTAQRVGRDYLLRGFLN